MNKALRKVLVLALAIVLSATAVVGGTFAWFTDTVESSQNVIKAGKLDIEVVHEGNKVDENYKIFEDGFLWEPGAVMYENLTIKNVGNLDLEYRLSVSGSNPNFVVDAEGNTTNYNLADVLKYAIVPEGVTINNRADVLALNNWTPLNETIADFVDVDLLDTEADTLGLVVYWEPTDKDNNWNIQNGKSTSDGLGYLKIDLGISVDAKQMMSEIDSFDNTYDAEADYGKALNPSDLPMAKVTNLPMQLVFVDGQPLGLDSSYKFETMQDAAAAEASDYALWHADFVVKFDKDVKADSVLLAGQYETFSKDWIPVSPTMLNAYKEPGAVIPAGTEIRLLKDGAGININYKELCELVKEFNCGVLDLTDENAGTVFSVDLRIYEVDPALTPGSTNNFECETGNSYSVKRVDYTFPAAQKEPVAHVYAWNKSEIDDVPPVEYYSFDDLSNAKGTVEPDAIYTFSSTETIEKAQKGGYMNWEADFVVSLDRDIKAGELVLAGNYGGFSLAVENPDPVSAGEEIPLIESFKSKLGFSVGVSYEMVVTQVKQFVCGAADVNDALEGATITVKLVLTDPANGTKLNIGEHKYTF